MRESKETNFLTPNLNYTQQAIKTTEISSNSINYECLDKGANPHKLHQPKSDSTQLTYQLYKALSMSR